MKKSIVPSLLRSFTSAFFLINLMVSLCIAQDAHKSSELPNIIWLTIEDASPNLGAYGDTFTKTPNIDAFSKDALRYNLVWSNSPVCSPARTAIISGMYPTTLGGHNHRSEIGLPPSITLYPKILRENGYYVTNNYKEEYNVVHADGNRDIWDDSSGEAHYKNRPYKDMPFFAVFNSMISHGSSIRSRADKSLFNPDLVPIPPYHPDTPGFRRDWAQYYNSISSVDDWFGQMMEQIRADGLLENTIIFFYSDHGAGMPTYKTFASNRGLQVPLLVYVPEKFHHLAPNDYKAGGFTNRPVEFVDLAPTLLSLIGVEPPDWMQGKPFMGHHMVEDDSEYIFGSRGRMDEQIDMVRSVRDKRYIYIRNYMPHLMHGFFNEYLFTFESTNEWRDLNQAGGLSPAQAKFWKSKPPEELYDLKSDPNEIQNLANSPLHKNIIDKFREIHRNHTLETRDVQFLPESEMHRRAKNSTAAIWQIQNSVGVTSIYEMAQDPKRYDLERIFTIAELAADYDLGALPQLELGLKDIDPAVRYWAAMGILIRGKRAFDATAASVRVVLSDPNPSVSAIACNIIIAYSDGDDRQKALDKLIDLSNPEKNGVYTALEVLNIFKNNGYIDDATKQIILGNKKEDPNSFWRGANQYIPRLLPNFIHPYLH